MSEQIPDGIHALAKILPQQSEKELAEAFRLSQWSIEEILEFKPYDNSAARTVEGILMLATRLHATNLLSDHLVKSTETEEALGVILLRTEDKLSREESHIRGAVLCRNPNRKQEEYYSKFEEFMTLVESFLNSPVYQRRAKDTQPKLSD